MMDLVTSGDIARLTNADSDRVRYAIRKLGAEPVGRAGLVRLFDAGTTKAVRAYLKNRPPRKGSKP